ncbi:unnamed protein product [Lupinus luteus]|uniref:Uncharacterized protein n=1 Tax=Lupinus luteus TaxID=3873 RepID=A0AAV1XZL4_LUPLU
MALSYSMSVLISFAVLIFACSYLKLVASLENENEHGDLESDDEGESDFLNAKNNKSLNNKHSLPSRYPIVYLFGGLSAMFALVASALLILACSYWKLSTPSENENQHRDLESYGEGESGFINAKDGETVIKVCENKVLVIMAGNDKPTFLATPTCANNSSSLQCRVVNDSDKDIQIPETYEGLKDNINNDVKATSTSSQQ